jgi:hypothetical protein
MIEYVIGVVVLLFLVYLLFYYFNSTTSLSEYADASTLLEIPSTLLADPKSTNYAYSLWIYINDWSVKYGHPKTLFTRMGSNPRVDLGLIDNTLTTTVRLQSGSLAQCMVENIPIQKWTNIIITVDEKALDTYINGKLVKTCILVSPQASIADDTKLQLTPNGGFAGYTARFKYWGTSISPQEAWNVYKNGPGGNFLINFLNQFKLQLSFIKGNETKAQITI